LVNTGAINAAGRRRGIGSVAASHSTRSRSRWGASERQRRPGRSAAGQRAEHVS